MVARTRLFGGHKFVMCCGTLRVRHPFSQVPLDAFSSAGFVHELPRPLDVIPAESWAPGRADAWWTTVLPIAILIAVVTIHYVAPDFYLAHVLPEGYGFLELSQFFLAGAAAVLCFHALGYEVAKGSRLLWILVLLFALAAFYIAGEEHSWGQHFFNWNTPSYWSASSRCSGRSIRRSWGCRRRAS